MIVVQAVGVLSLVTGFALVAGISYKVARMKYFKVKRKLFGRKPPKWPEQRYSDAEY
jgi:hypothetical protein